MKLVSYQKSDKQVHLGAIKDNRIVNLNRPALASCRTICCNFCNWAQRPCKPLNRR